MTNDTRKAERTEESWLRALAAAWSKLGTAGATPSREQLAAAMAEDLGVTRTSTAAWLTACLGAARYVASPTHGASDAIEEEAAANSACRAAFLPALQARLQARIDDLDGATAGRTVCKDCLEITASEGRVARKWLSTLGTLELTRRWSHCTPCGHGLSLAQQWLRLPDGDFTAALSEAITRVSTTVPHGMAVQLLAKTLGVRVSAHAAQNEVEQRARSVMALHDAEAKRLRPCDAKGLQRQVPAPLDAVEEAPDVAYLEVDGVYAMTRQERVEDRQPAPARSRGGKGRRYTLEGKEIKNAVLYRADKCVEESDSRGCILAKTYVSHLGNNKEFETLLWAEMRRQRFDEASLLVLLSDGADWIRLLPESMPCKDKVLLVLDLFHAKHRVWEVARALHGDKTPEAKAWADEQCLRIEAGEVDTVIEALRFVKPRGKDKRELVEALRTYFQNNRSRMDYPAYRARGIRVTTGAVESTNYHVTGARLKLQGMRWSPDGAAQMARLRADLFNDRWERRTREILAA